MTITPDLSEKFARVRRSPFGCLDETCEVTDPTCAGIEQHKMTAHPELGVTECGCGQGTPPAAAPSDRPTCPREGHGDLAPTGPASIAVPGGTQQPGVMYGCTFPGCTNGAAVLDPRVADLAPGDAAVFTYSLAPDPTSEISADLAPRSRSTVTVLSFDDNDGGPTFWDRMEAGQPATYRVRFADGHEATVFEDELEAPHWPDTATSRSRQHFIDTGRYMTVAEVVEAERQDAEVAAG